MKKIIKVLNNQVNNKCIPSKPYISSSIERRVSSSVPQIRANSQMPFKIIVKPNQHQRSQSNIPIQKNQIEPKINLIETYSIKTRKKNLSKEKSEKEECHKKKVTPPLPMKQFISDLKQPVNLISEQNVSKQQGNEKQRKRFKIKREKSKNKSNSSLKPQEGICKFSSSILQQKRKQSPKKSKKNLSEKASKNEVIIKDIKENIDQLKSDPSLIDAKKIKKLKIFPLKKKNEKESININYEKKQVEENQNINGKRKFCKRSFKINEYSEEQKAKLLLENTLKSFIQVHKQQKLIQHTDLTSESYIPNDVLLVKKDENKFIKKQNCITVQSDLFLFQEEPLKQPQSPITESFEQIKIINSKDSKKEFSLKVEQFLAEDERKGVEQHYDDSYEDIFQKQDDNYEIIQGSFQKGHQPLSITLNKAKGDFLVSWKSIPSNHLGKSSIKPENTFYSFKEIRKYGGEPYVEFLEKRFFDKQFKFVNERKNKEKQQKYIEQIHQQEVEDLSGDEGTISKKRFNGAESYLIINQQQEEQSEKQLESLENKQQQEEVNDDLHQNKEQIFDYNLGYPIVKDSQKDDESNLFEIEDKQTINNKQIQSNSQEEGGEQQILIVNDNEEVKEQDQLPIEQEDENSNNKEVQLCEQKKVKNVMDLEELLIQDQNQNSLDSQEKQDSINLQDTEFDQQIQINHEIYQQNQHSQGMQTDELNAQESVKDNSMQIEDVFVSQSPNKQHSSIHDKDIFITPRKSNSQSQYSSETSQFHSSRQEGEENEGMEQDEVEYYNSERYQISTESNLMVSNEQSYQREDRFDKQYGNERINKKNAKINLSTYTDEEEDEQQRGEVDFQNDQKGSYQNSDNSNINNEFSSEEYEKENAIPNQYEIEDNGSNYEYQINRYNATQIYLSRKENEEHNYNQQDQQLYQQMNRLGYDAIPYQFNGLEIIPEMVGEESESEASIVVDKQTDEKNLPHSKLFIPLHKGNHDNNLNISKDYVSIEQEEEENVREEEGESNKNTSQNEKQKKQKLGSRTSEYFKISSDSDPENEVVLVEIDLNQKERSKEISKSQQQEQFQDKITID